MRMVKTGSGQCAPIRAPIRVPSSRALRGWLVKLALLVSLGVGAMLLSDWAIAQSAPPAETAPVVPQEAVRPSGAIRVATRLIPPFVMEQNGQLTGFSVDLWNKIAAEMGQQTELKVHGSLPEMLQAVEAQTADAAIAAISITAEREAKFDFSQPMFNSGLQILVRSAQTGGLGPNLLDLFSPALRQLLLFAVGMVVAIAHLAWLFERRHPNSPISKSYFPGIFEATWWAASTLATQAEEMPKGPLGRLMAVAWMFISVLFVAYFTATVTTGMTVRTLQGDIQSLADLKGRSVATTAGSTAANFLQDKRIKTLAVDKIEVAYEALLRKKADAVVADAPVLMYYAANQGKDKVQLVGDVLQEENYGILLPKNSAYRKPVNSALLKLRENGTYQQLYTHWFKPEAEGKETES
jgi:polar amino acid transport system substrate-binding protein